jgi:hypothetical protein
MRFVWLTFFVGFLFVPAALAQRDAPVWETYLPQVSIYHDTLEGKNALTVDFLFKKNGGPIEHREHQAYVFAYLKKDEEQILKLAADAALISKPISGTPRLLESLTGKKLVVMLDSQAVKLNAPNGRLPRFPDAAGIPRPSGANSIVDFSFPFRFTFPDETLFQAMSKLGNFQIKDAQEIGKTTYYSDTLKLLVFIPVNNSGYANKVSPEMQKAYDFAHGMNSSTVILYFRPLPYELEFSKYEDRLLLYIN